VLFFVQIINFISELVPTELETMWIWLMLKNIILSFEICFIFSDVLLEWYLSCKAYYDCFRSKTVCCQLKTDAFMFQYVHPEALFPNVHRQSDHTCVLGRNVWRYQRGHQEPPIEERQTIKWPKEQGHNNKKWSAKHHIEKFGQHESNNSPIYVPDIH
jgi:hypothetical protein